MVVLNTVDLLSTRTLALCESAPTWQCQIGPCPPSGAQTAAADGAGRHVSGRASPTGNRRRGQLRDHPLHSSSPYGATCKPSFVPNAVYQYVFTHGIMGETSTELNLVLVRIQKATSALFLKLSLCYVLYISLYQHGGFLL